MRSRSWWRNCSARHRASSRRPKWRSHKISTCDLATKLGVKDYSVKPIARQLAEWCVATGFDDIPAEIHRHNPLRVVDTIGLILAGSRTPAVDAARSLALHTG